MQTTGSNSLRLVQRPLWEVLLEHLRPAETEEVKRAVGTLLIEENKSLFEEASALTDILGDVQMSTGALVARQQLCNNPQRRLVEAELHMLLDRLRGAASIAPFAGSSVRERDPESVVPRAGEKEKMVYDYLVASSQLQPADGRPRTPQCRPGTASSRPTTASSLSRPSTASSAGGSSQSYDPTALVSSMQGKLNVYAIDAIKEPIQAALREEKAAIMDDIAYLTALLEDETDLQAKASAPPPSLSLLKEYGTKLHEAVVAEEARLEHEVRVSQMFTAATTSTSKAHRLRNIVDASRKPPPPLPLPNRQSLSASQELGLSSMSVLGRVPEDPQSSEEGEGEGKAAEGRPASQSSTTAGAGAGPGTPLAQQPQPRPSSQPLPPSGTTHHQQQQQQASSSSTTTEILDVQTGVSSTSTSTYRLTPQLSPNPIFTSPTPSPGLADMQQRQRWSAEPEAGRAREQAGAAGTCSLSPATRPPSSGRIRPSSPGRLRALVSEASAVSAAGRVEGGLSTSTSSLLGASVSSEPSASVLLRSHSGSARSSMQLPLQPPLPPQPPLPTGSSISSQGLHKATPPKRHIKNVGEMLEAEIDALRGGVASILAKHNYIASPGSPAATATATAAAATGISRSAAG